MTARGPRDARATDPAAEPADPAAEPAGDTGLTAAAADLAAELLGESRLIESRRDARRSARLSRLAADPESMEFTLALTDQVGRIRDPRRAVRRLTDLVAEHGTPRFLGPLDRTLLRAATVVGAAAPSPVAALVRRRVRRETGGVVIPAEDPDFARHLAHRHEQGFPLNVNLLGEAILGDVEAGSRLQQVLAHIRRPDVDYVSVKASALCARISSVAFDHSVARIADALGTVFRAAAAQQPPVFVNLDMEEYRDLELTLDAFRRALSAEDLRGLDAGIVLQAYLPDSHDALEELAAWALERRANGGGTTKVRIVKGANLAMERVEAELHGWVPAPYAGKVDVDASYKRLLARALQKRGLSVGLASHNLFDIAWGLVTARALGAEDRLEIEMLEGMAPGEAEALRRRGIQVRLYAPAVRDDEFDSAVAYLVRRLDENSAPDNYLRHLLSDDPDALVDERDRFALAVARRTTVPTRARRDQDRAAERIRIDLAQPFTNQADTDWAKVANWGWIRHHVESLGNPPAERSAAEADVDLAVDVALGSGWRSTTCEDRAVLLTQAANELEAHRGPLIATMVADASKVIAEADIEVSEAVDYAAYYARQALALDRHIATHRALGTVVVAPPWNFPLAIPLGGALAALAAGNAVILKPAPETVATAWAGVQCLWEAGIPKDALQFLPCADDGPGTRLVTHAGVDAVILTGSYETAAMFLGWRPRLHLLAETSGKNAVIVTAAADLDLAVADIVRSAFGHAGQKCSAASLVIVEQSVLQAGRFLSKLADATRTLVVGSAGDPATEVPPLIRPPSGPLERALTTLDPGEEWLVAPRRTNDRLWSPGIVTGVQNGSWFHHTECFGPVLGIMAARDLDEAIALQNATGYGLTGGIQTLDPAEVRYWLDRVEVGNAYVNRAITGAVVRRQPFGGWKRSAVGPTAKTGGPGYVPALCQWEDSSGDRLAAARASYPQAWARLSAPEDPSGLRSEINVLRHRPFPAVTLWVGDDADPEDVALCELAATTVGVEVTREMTATAGRIRTLGTPPDHLLRDAHAAGITVDTRRPVADGDIEILRWVREQAVSVTAHRYGRPIRRDNLGLS